MYAALLFLLSCLLPLHYDDSRRVGDAAIIQLDDWKVTALVQCCWQGHKVEAMRRIARAAPNDLKDLAEEEALFEDMTATLNALQSVEDNLYSLGYRRRPPLPPLSVYLLSLPYDNSRRVGDAAVSLLHEWTLMVSRCAIAQGARLDQLKHQPGAASTGEDEVAEQEKVVKALCEAEKAGKDAETLMLLWGYRRLPPAPPPEPPPAGPSSPDKR
jgi:hypothetical protein